MNITRQAIEKLEPGIYDLPRDNKKLESRLNKIFQELYDNMIKEAVEDIQKEKNS